MVKPYLDVIGLDEVKNLSQLFQERVKRSPDKVAYKRYNDKTTEWETFTWQQMAGWVSRWQQALRKEGLQSGDRVAIMYRNAPEWVVFEQAALGLGLVVVPLYTNDRAENIGYIIADSGVQVLLIEKQDYWNIIREARDQFGTIKRIVAVEPVTDTDEPRLTQVEEWASSQSSDLAKAEFAGDQLATIVYTSGTTGRPKGVMLSHHNILWNANSSSRCEPFYTTDIYLSFLPLSHMLERTVSYYLPMMTGGEVNYARAIETLADDLVGIRPTILVTVPRIFERVYNKVQLQLANKSPLARKLFAAAVNVGWHRFEFKQGRAAWHPKLLFWPILNKLVAQKIVDKLGGRLRFAITGGAPLSSDIAQVFIGLGITILQGYGMTELSPVTNVNLPHQNRPDSVGPPLPEVEIKLGEQDELLVRCPGVMLGYWQNQQATDETIDKDGWLHTGDKARVEHGHVYITGRIKEIIVLSNGEKVPPADLEMAIGKDGLFEQVMILGEGKPYLSAIVVLNPEQWTQLAAENGVADSRDNINSSQIKPVILKRIATQIASFPGYAKVVQVHCTLDPWTIEEALMTPKMSIKRNNLMKKYADEIALLYKGH